MQVFMVFASFQIIPYGMPWPLCLVTSTTKTNLLCQNFACIKLISKPLLFLYSDVKFSVDLKKMMNSNQNKVLQKKIRYMSVILF